MLQLRAGPEDLGVAARVQLMAEMELLAPVIPEEAVVVVAVRQAVMVVPVDQA